MGKGWHAPAGTVDRTGFGLGFDKLLSGHSARPVGAVDSLLALSQPADSSRASRNIGQSQTESDPEGSRPIQALTATTVADPASREVTRQRGRFAVRHPTGSPPHQVTRPIATSTS